MNWSSVKQNFSTKNPVIFRVELLPCLSQIRIRGLCSNKKMHLNNSNMWYEKPCFAHSKHSNYWALIYWIWLPWSQICIVTYIWIIKGSLVVVGEGLLSSRCCPGCGIKEPTCNSDFLTIPLTGYISVTGNLSETHICGILASHICEWGLETCVHMNPPGDSDAHQSWGTTALRRPAKSFMDVTKKRTYIRGKTGQCSWSQE